MKKFLCRLILVLFPLSTIPIVNYTIDPSHVYDQYEQRVVGVLQNHLYVVNANPNIDERSYKKALIDSCKDDVDILVLGSSRVMQISEKMLNGESLLNLSVSGATYEDVTALLYHYLSKKKCPGTIILGVDPQHFNANIGDTRWKVLQNEYAAYSKDVLATKVRIMPNFEKWENLVSITYFQTAIKTGYPQKSLKYSDSLVSEDDIINGTGYCRDGSIVYGRTYHHTSLEETNRLARTEVYSQWNNFDGLSHHEITRWNKLIQYIQDKGIKVYFFEAAYHPIMYQRFIDEKRAVMIDAMDLINQMAKKNEITIIGSFDPSDNSLQDSDFYDGMHMRRNIVNQFIASTFN